MQVKADVGERRVYVPVSVIFLVEEQSSGQIASASALHLSVAPSQGQRKSEHEQLLLLISLFPGEMQEQGMQVQEQGRTCPVLPSGTEGTVTPSDSGCGAKRHGEGDFAERRLD